MAESLGIRFYTGTMFPKQYQNVAFIARHGSWNREQKYGYDVVIAKISGHKAKIEPFMTGLLNNEKNEFYGRPTYVYPMPMGGNQDGKLHHRYTGTRPFHARRNGNRPTRPLSRAQGGDHR